MQIERTVKGLRRTVEAWRRAGEQSALVPTMGALHEGHLSLVRQGKTLASRVTVFLFVNPKQFSAGEDFAIYPRNEQQDAAMLEAEGVDLLYAPAIEEIYPPEFDTSVTVAGLGERWEGAARPGHFAGMATVVAKLLIQADADFAMFGEKDYQQLQIIRRLVRDLDLRVEIVSCPIVRDAAGLALSSRNVRLSEPELSIARQLNLFLNAAVAAARQRPLDLAAIANETSANLRRRGFTGIDYLAFCDPVTLEPLAVLDGPARIIAAVHLGTVRLLDNMSVEPVE